MQTITRINELKISPRKIRLITDAIRGLSLDEAQDALTVIQKRGARDLDKALKSAVANAVNNSNLEKKNLIIKTIDINEGPSFKRFHPSTRGRIHPYKKRTSDIRIVLQEKPEIQSHKLETNLKEKNYKKESITKKEVKK